MRPNHYSRTAIIVAGVRAVAYAAGDRHVLPDPFAIRLIPTAWRLIIGNRLLRWLYFQKINGRMVRGIACSILGRSQFTEDRVAALLDQSLEQFVLLGAGLDSFAYRQPELGARLRVFEVDHPATQRFKLERIARLGLKRPSFLEYLPCDFERDSIRELLLDSTYSPKKKTMFGWLGVVPYMTPEAIEHVFGELATVAPADSEIVFDYYDQETAFGPAADAAALKIRRDVARKGEAMHSGHTPETLRAILENQGWQLAEIIDPPELERRYFSRPATVTREPFSFSWFARAVLKNPGGS